MPTKEGKTYRAVVKIDGRRVAQKRGFLTKKEARTWEDETRKALLAPASNDADMRFIEFANQYLDMCKLKFTEKTYFEKRAVLRSFIRFLGGDPLFTQVTKKSISDYLIHQVEIRSKNAANKDRKNLMALFNWGRKVADLSNPVVVDKFPHSRSFQYTPSEADILKVLSCSSGEDRVLLTCFLCTGARKNEILKLRWNDVNFEKEGIRLWTKKTRDGSMSGEWLPMNTDLKEALFWQWHRRDKTSDFVFVNPETGKPYTDRRRTLFGLCKKAGVRQFGFHAIRRYFADMLADKLKQSTKVVQRFLRHKNVRTTEIYLENINHDLKAVANQITLIGNMAEANRVNDPSVQTEPAGINKSPSRPF
ncbi:MAG TPA: site-specific integrase [Syntrophales bacterium]|nr:site-specific integrase [Syntrophales bacterium]